MPVTSLPPHTLNIHGAPAAPGQSLPPTQRFRLSWLRALPLLPRHITRTMPWATLLAGCLAGTGVLAVLAHFSGASQPLGPGTVRLTFLPAVAALAFIPRDAFRPLTQTTPVPAWVAPTGQILLAVPVLALTCWAQLRIAAGTIPPGAIIYGPAAYPLIAQLTGWCAVTVAAAACTDRTRYADLGGAVAAPVSLAAIAFVWYLPITSRFLAEPPATAHGVTIAWYAIAAAALALTCLAMRDQWHRYTRSLHRPLSAGHRGTGALRTACVMPRRGTRARPPSLSGHRAKDG
jgi:hypothetical protein